jgi:hypothetical protein
LYASHPPARRPVREDASFTSPLTTPLTAKKQSVEKMKISNRFIVEI